MRQSTRLIINSFVTYSRMLVTVGIGLLVTRLLIHTLGISDFGLFMALGASATLLAMIRDALTSSGERHMAFEIGRGDQQALQRVFASSLLVHLVLAAGAVALGTALMPVIISVIDVPADRQAAAWWVLASTIAVTGIAICSSPFSAMIIAHQEIPISTAFELVSRLFTLGSVLLLQVVSTDRLATYAVLTVVVGLVLDATLAIICMIRYPACRRGLRGATKQSAWELVSFGGWNILSSMVLRVRMQATIFLLNILFGTIVNAAYAIAVQAASYQHQLSWAMMGAIKPAMTTMQGRSGQSQSVVDLVRMSNKFPFFASLLMLTPVVWETELLLKLWLGEYPTWTPTFVRLSMLTMLVGTISNGYSTLMSSRGDLRGVTLLAVGTQVLAVLIGWLGAAFMGWGPDGFLWAALSLTSVFSLVRVLYVSRVAELLVSDYLRYTALPITMVFCVALVTSAPFYFFIPEGFVRLAMIAIIPSIAVCAASWTVGMTDVERGHFKRVFRNFVSLIKQKLKR